MDIATSIKTIKYLHNILAGNRNNITDCDYLAQKPEFTEQPQEKPLNHNTPENVGISSKHIMDFLTELTAEKGVNAHNIILSRNGEIFTQASFAPYRKEVWHVTHSVCKSVTSLAVGLLIGEGKINLQDNVYNILNEGETQNLIASTAVKKLTIEHLLTMSTGVDYKEPAILVEQDLFKGYLKSKTKFMAGEKFSYNSINSFLLACVIKKVSGEGVVQYLTPRLFEPLGITNISWEITNTEVEKGGWGMYITIEDLAKLGILLSQKGRWVVDGVEKQIVPENYISEATTTQITDITEHSNVEYGYHIWTRKRDGMYHFNGMFGQYAIVIPKHNIVIAYNSGCANFSNKSHALSCVDKYFADVEYFADKLPPSPKEYKKLLTGLGNLRYDKPFDTYKMNFFEKIKGKYIEYTNLDKLQKFVNFYTGEYEFEDNILGLLPFVVQCTNSNLGKGLKNICFEMSENHAVIKWTEDENIYDIYIKHGISKEFVIDYNGEKFLCATTSNIHRNKEGLVVLNVTLSLLESSCARTMMFVFNRQGILLSLDENPKVSDIFGNFTPDKNWIQEAMELKENRYAKYKLDQILSPKIIGVKKV